MSTNETYKDQVKRYGGRKVIVSSVLRAGLLLIFIFSIIEATSASYSQDIIISDGQRPLLHRFIISNNVGDSNSTHLFLNNHASSDFTDIYFTQNGANLPHWIENNVVNATWVNITGNGTVTIYYGGEISTSNNFTTTFIGGGDFSSGGYGSLEYNISGANVSRFTTPLGGKYISVWSSSKSSVISASSPYGYVREFGAIRDTNNNIVYEGGKMFAYYGALYSVSGGSILLKNSSDNGTTFGDSLTILTNTSCVGSEFFAIAPTSVKFGDTYGVWYSGAATEDSPRGMFYANGTDKNTLTCRGEVLNYTTFNDPVNITTVAIPWVVPLADGSFIVTFEGRNISDATSPHKVYAARSMDNGSSWTPLNGGNPILRSISTNPWESMNVANPKIIEVNSSYYILQYNGASDFTQYSVGFASASTDPLNWTNTSFTRLSTNPAMVGAPGTYGTETSGMVDDLISNKVWRQWHQQFSGGYNTGSIFYSEAPQIGGLEFKESSATNATIIGTAYDASHVYRTKLYSTSTDANITGNSQVYIFSIINSSTLPTVGNSASYPNRNLDVRRLSYRHDTQPSALIIDYVNTTGATQYWEPGTRTWNKTLGATAYIGSDSIDPINVEISNNGTSYIITLWYDNETVITTTSVLETSVRNNGNSSTIITGDPFTNIMNQGSFIPYWLQYAFNPTSPTITVSAESGTADTPTECSAGLNSLHYNPGNRTVWIYNQTNTMCTIWKEVNNESVITGNGDHNYTLNQVLIRTKKGATLNLTNETILFNASINGDTGIRTIGNAWYVNSTIRGLNTTTNQSKGYIAIQSDDLVANGGDGDTSWHPSFNISNSTFKYIGYNDLNLYNLGYGLQIGYSTLIHDKTFIFNNNNISNVYAVEFNVNRLWMKNNTFNTLLAPLTTNGGSFAFHGTESNITDINFISTTGNVYLESSHNLSVVNMYGESRLSGSFPYIKNSGNVSITNLTDINSISAEGMDTELPNPPPVYQTSNFSDIYFDGVGDDYYGFAIDDSGHTSAVRYINDIYIIKNGTTYAPLVLNGGWADVRNITLLPYEAVAWYPFAVTSTVLGNNIAIRNLTVNRYNVFLNVASSSAMKETFFIDSNLTTNTTVQFSSSGDVQVGLININSTRLTTNSWTGTPKTGTVINYYYADIQVIDSNGNPASGATVSISPNRTAWNPRDPSDQFPANITSTTTGADGHTPLPNETSSLAIPHFYASNNTYYYEQEAVTVNDSSGLYTYKNASIDSNKIISPVSVQAETIIIPNTTWRRASPNSYQNTTSLTLPQKTNWSILPGVTIWVNASSNRNFTAGWDGSTTIYANTTIPEWPSRSLSLKHDGTVVDTQNSNATGYVEFSYTGTNGEFNVTEGNNSLPIISFIADTPSNGSTISYNYIIINASTTDADNDNVSTVLNWNNTILGWYRFNNLTGASLVEDSSGYGRNGTFVGNTTANSSTARFGNGARLDNSNDYTNLSSNYNFTKGQAFSILIKLENISLDAGNGLFGNFNNTALKGMFLESNTTGHPRFLYRVGTTTNEIDIRANGTVKLNNGTNATVTMTYNGNGSALGVKFYINKSEVESYWIFSNTLSSSISNLNNTVVGDVGQGFGRYLNAIVDEVVIYNRVLSLAEINATIDGTNLSINMTGLPDGEYNFTAYAQDENGAVNSTEKRYITVGSSGVYTPPTPTNLINTTGNFWINYTWTNGTGNVTDGYNTSVNGVWTNGTALNYSNNTVGPHNWSNISVYAYNSSGTGSLNSTPVSQNTQISNNAPVMATIGNKVVTAGNWLNFTVYAGDADSDIVNYSTNATKGTFGEVYRNSTQVMKSPAVYTKVLDFTMNNAGSGRFNFSFDLRKVNGGTVAVYGKIYKNSVPIGTEQTATATELVTFTEWINTSWNAGDTIELWTKSDGIFNAQSEGLTVNVTNSFTWKVAQSEAGTYLWNFSASDGYMGSDYEVITVTVSNTTPPSPVNLANTTGNFWVNHTWQAGTGNITDSYNVSVNGVWSNGSANPYYNNTLAAHAWSNISVYAYNNTFDGSLNATPASQNTQIPNNAITISGVSASYLLTEGDTLNIDAGYSDADSDVGTFDRNFTQGVFNTGTGVLAWATGSSSAGTYNWQINVTDGYGSVSMSNFTVTVSESPAGNISNLANTTGNFYINWTWSAGLNATEYDIQINGTDTGADVVTLYYNATYSAHATRTISVRSHNLTSDTYSSWTNQTTTIPNNAPVQATIGSKSGSAGNWLNFSISSTDADSDTLTYGNTTTKGTFNTSTGAFSWLPTVADIGSSYIWVFNTTDGYGGEDSESVTVTISSITINNSLTNSVATYISPASGQAVTFYINNAAGYSWTVDGVDQGVATSYFNWAGASDGDLHYITGTYTGGSVEWRASVKRLMAAAAIPTINQSYYNDLMNDTRNYDLEAMIYDSIQPETDILGTAFWLLLWLMIFVAYWIRQRQMTFPTILGLIFGGVIIATLPEEYQIYAVGLVAIGITTIIYLLSTKKSE